MQFPPWIYLLIAALVPLLMVGLIFAAVVQYLHNVRQPTVTRRARVVGKRVTPARSKGGSPQYLYLFEFEGGEREEHDVYQRRYSLAEVGDAVEVDTRGTLLWDLRRAASS